MAPQTYTMIEVFHYEPSSDEFSIFTLQQIPTKMINVEPLDISGSSIYPYFLPYDLSGNKIRILNKATILNLPQTVTKIRVTYWFNIKEKLMPVETIYNYSVARNKTHSVDEYDLTLYTTTPSGALYSITAAVPWSTLYAGPQPLDIIIDSEARRLPDGTFQTIIGDLKIKSETIGVDQPLPITKTAPKTPVNDILLAEQQITKTFNALNKAVAELVNIAEQRSHQIDENAAIIYYLINKYVTPENPLLPKLNEIDIFDGSPIHVINARNVREQL
jgi:hypothetical protein